MDEFKPENQTKSDNTLKPDASDRPERRPNRARSNPLKNARFTVSRQQMMIGVGVLVLILLIIAISSALKSPNSSEPTSSTNAEKSIDLSQQTSSSVTPVENTSSTPQEISRPEVQTSTSSSQNLPPMIDSQGQRVEIPGDIADSLNQQQPAINQAINPPQLNTQNQTKVTKPTTQVPAPKPQKTTPQKPVDVKTPSTKPVTPPATKPTTTKPVVSGTLSASNLSAIPASNYTLQLSGASRQDTLESFAKKNLNGNYAIYKTQRNGNPWYVLIYGNYRNINEAKQAVSSLPAAVQAKKPWVRPINHVHRDLK